MTISRDLSNAMAIASGVFWTLTYLLIIRRGFQDKTYGMPFFALCANISWEFIFSFVLPHTPPQRYRNRFLGAWYIPENFGSHLPDRQTRPDVL